jgi:hypothetical protein
MELSAPSRYATAPHIAGVILIAFLLAKRQNDKKAMQQKRM